MVQWWQSLNVRNGWKLGDLVFQLMRSTRFWNLPLEPLRQPLHTLAVTHFEPLHTLVRYTSWPLHTLGRYTSAVARQRLGIHTQRDRHGYSRILFALPTDSCRAIQFQSSYSISPGRYSTGLYVTACTQGCEKRVTNLNRAGKSMVGIEMTLVKCSDWE